MNLNKLSKTFTLLLVVLGINTLRYGTYLLEGSADIYNWVLFILNLLSLVYVLILKLSESRTEVDSSSVKDT